MNLNRTSFTARTWLPGVVAALEPAFCQTVTGSISGTASGADGAVIPGVAIELTDLDRATQYRAETNGEGIYVAALPPGSYRLTARRAGFQTFVVDRIPVSTQQKATLDLRMEIGTLNQTVEVSASSLLVDSASSTLSSVVDNKRIQDLPVNGRNIYSLVSLVPGVFRSRPLQDAPNNFRPNRFSINGGNINSNEILIDGMSASMQDNIPTSLAVGIIPSMEGVQEFRIQTNAYSAEYGRTGGAESCRWCRVPEPTSCTEAPSSSCATACSTPTPGRRTARASGKAASSGTSTDSASAVRCGRRRYTTAETGPSSSSCSRASACGPEPRRSTQSPPNSSGAATSPRRLSRTASGRPSTIPRPRALIRRVRAGSCEPRFRATSCR